MSKLFIGFLSAAQLSAVHAAGHVIEQFALSEGQKLVAALKTTSIGATVAADIHTVQDQSLTGAQKFEQVVANTAPLVLKYVTGGGLSAFTGDAEDIARELVQSIFNDTLGAAKKAVAAVPAASSDTAQAA